jgi:hypothetical protein
MAIAANHFAPALMAIKQPTIEKVEVSGGGGAIAASLAVRLQQFLSFGKFNLIDNCRPYRIHRSVCPYAFLAIPRLPGNGLKAFLLADVCGVCEQPFNSGSGVMIFYQSQSRGDLWDNRTREKREVQKRKLRNTRSWKNEKQSRKSATARRIKQSGLGAYSS